MKPTLRLGAVGVRYGFCVVACALGFILSCKLLDRVLAPPDLPPIVREKVAHLASHGDEYDAIFIGSSRFQNNLVPAVFDRVVADHGFQVRSFNAGIPGMEPPEDAYFLDQILALKLKRLRWVFVEAEFFDTTVREEQKGTLRGVYWHDLSRFVLLCRRLMVKSEQKGFKNWSGDVFERCSDLCDHVVLFAQNFTNLGRGSLLIGPRIFGFPPAPMQWDLLGQDRAGWLPAGEEKAPSAEDVANLEKELAKRRKAPPVKAYGDAIAQEALETMVAKILRSGARPIVVISPRTRGKYFWPRRENLHTNLNFCDPLKYPELYRTENRVDTSHLNPAGAEIFTRLLAERFVEEGLTSTKGTP